jgi:antitoxin component of MazEF toxin-antitoxin module
MAVTRKILKVGNSRALVLDRTIAAALGLGPDTSEIPVTIEDGRVTLLPPASQDPFDALRAKLAKYSEGEARKIAADEVAAMRPRTTRRWKAAR